MPITSSSTSSSDTPGTAWRRFLGVFAMAGLCVFALLALLCIVLDPYDTGRLALLRARGVPDTGPRLANASRARDPAFQGAIIGNSHVQILDPARLKAATGIPFVSLMVPATRPREQLVLLDYFLAHHRAPPPRALVIGLDDYWCEGNPTLPTEKPFPYWLYAADLRSYLGGLIRLGTLERLVPRLQLALRVGRVTAARPDGYWDYEPDYALIGYGPGHHRDALAHQAVPLFSNTSGRFPALEALALRLDKLPAGIAVALVRPPLFKTAIAPPGTEASSAEAACRVAVERLADHPGRALVDWREGRSESADPDNFIDHTHYRARVARLLEGAIGQALLRLDAAKP